MFKIKIGILFTNHYCLLPIASFLTYTSLDEVGQVREIFFCKGKANF